MTMKPRPKPCDSCPFRRDVPSGVWSAAEYDKLATYDGETWTQPPGVFVCHTAPDSAVCAGWAAVSGNTESLALRLASSLDPKVDVQACLDYTSPVPVFSSGTEAAEHGKRDIDAPSAEATEKVRKVMRTRDRQGKPCQLG